ncbi:MAG: alanine--tRNA ligase [Janthinobacterium lividum]
MLGSELRRKYLEFFEAKASKRLPSDSLVPNDPTLLFTSAGMVQFKPYFLGLQTPPAPRATTAQKCLRTTDIEDVGDTSHCTFFEMMGNFSFGDYFKAEAIAYAWEFLFDVLKLDIQNVRVTVHEDDEEAYGLWRNAGMPDAKIFRFDEHANYWPAGAISKGPNGPCGPCSEIFYDTQAHLAPTPDGEWDDKRWLEIWNLVFMQFDRSDGPTLTPLPRRNIDTGMGLERTAAVLAGLRGPFETDLFAPILRQLEEMSGLKYTSQDSDPKDIAFRRVADHVRATAFCIADGVLPSNVGRGYVLRRLMRRAILAGRRTLGIKKSILEQILPTVIDQRKSDYPELEAKRETILRYAIIEEKQFRRTLESGTARLQSLLDSGSVTGDDAFVLFTTYGFPVEMTAELASETGLSVDMTRYDELWQQHLLVSEGGKTREVFTDSVVPALRERSVVKTLFVGYSESRTRGQITAIVKSGQLVDSASEGETVQIVLDQTTFYAEAGGQVGDTGQLHGENGAAEVSDTQKDSGYWFHTATLTAGELRVGDTLDAQIDAGRRASIQRNHTTTHLLHKALQTVLGPHVQQRGSLVAPDRLRFDFSHDKSLTGDETRQVEGLVNEKILDDLPIQIFEKPIEDAKQMGATMLFGEKYGDIVRVVEAGDYSLEFCGGTHLAHTSQAGLFKVISEGSSQAGVRRIEAVTGKAALMRTLDQERLLSDIAASLKTSPLNAPSSVEKLQAELKLKGRELTALQKAAAGGQVDALIAAAKSGHGFPLIVHSVMGNADGETLRTLAEETLNKLRSGVVILGGTDGGKVSLAVRVSKDLVARGVHAGNIVKVAAPIVGGGGGGRPDAAQAGGKDASKLTEALATAERLVGEMVGA